MALVSITATQVLPSAAADIRTGTVGAATTVTAGSIVYLDAATSTLLLAVATSATTAAAVGMCLNGGSTGQVVRYVASDTALQIGTAASLTPGMTLYVSDDTAGSLATVWTDLETGGSVDFVTSCGIVTAATLGVTRFQINASGVSKP